jgi:hypothetical protein
MKELKVIVLKNHPKYYQYDENTNCIILDSLLENISQVEFNIKSKKVTIGYEILYIANDNKPFRDNNLCKIHEDELIKIKIKSYIENQCRYLNDDQKEDILEFLHDNFNDLQKIFKNEE